MLRQEQREALALLKANLMGLGDQAGSSGGTRIFQGFQTRVFEYALGVLKYAFRTGARGWYRTGKSSECPYLKGPTVVEVHRMEPLPLVPGVKVCEHWRQHLGHPGKSPGHHFGQNRTEALCRYGVVCSMAATDIRFCHCFSPS